MATLIAAEQWPNILRRERSLSWVPVFGNEAGPPGLDGTSQYRNSIGGGLWRCVYNEEQLRRREHVMAWLTMEAKLRGGMTPIDVPLLMFRYQPTAASVTATSGWAARAIAGRITVASSSIPIETGMHFSINHSGSYGWRLFRIDSIVFVSGSNWDITFWPPARAVVSAAVNLQFVTPRCVMRLASSDSMDLELEQRKQGNPSAEFIEAY